MTYFHINLDPRGKKKKVLPPILIPVVTMEVFFFFFVVVVSFVSYFFSPSPSYSKRGTRLQGGTWDVTREGGAGGWGEAFRVQAT